MFKLKLSEDDIYELQNGDQQEIFKKIFESAYHPLCYYILSLSKGVNDGEDLAQEALIKFWKIRDRFNSPKGIMAFLFTTIRNAYLNTIRHNMVRQKHIAETKDELDMSEAPLVEAEYIHALQEEIEKLPTACKQVFKLLYYNGLSNQEAAQMLNLSENNVAQQKRNAIDRLRVAIANKKFILIAIIVTMLGFKQFFQKFSHLDRLSGLTQVTANNHKYH